MNWQIRQTVDLHAMEPQRVNPACLFRVGDVYAHQWIVRVKCGREDADLSGYVVTALVRRKDKKDVLLRGRVEGNTAIVDLDGNCYAVPGYVVAHMVLSNGDQVITVAEGIWQVMGLDRDVIIDPAAVVPTLPELLGKIAAMEQATMKAEAIREEMQADIAALNDYPWQLHAKLTLTRSTTGIAYDVSALQDAVKSLSLVGADANVQYCAFVYRNPANTRKRVYIYRAGDTIDDANLICNYNAVLDGVEDIEETVTLSESNGSGITGTAVVNWSLVPNLPGSANEYDVSYDTTGLHRECLTDYQSGEQVQATAAEEAQKAVDKVAPPFDTEQPLQVMSPTGGFARIFRSVSCIGDSLTRGAFNTLIDGVSGSVDLTDLSYPAYLARILHTTVNNFGVSGATANNSTTKGWMTRSELDAYKFWDIAPADAYVIALGTNDLAQAHGFDGTLADISESDWTANAQTSVGGYAAIIQRIRSVQPKAVIFCATIPNWRNRYTVEAGAAANAMIRQIAEHSGCWVIDFEQYGVQLADVPEYMTKYTTGSHGNALGYYDAAVKYASYMDYIIRHNMTAFNTVQFVGTEYEYQS